LNDPYVYRDDNLRALGFDSYDAYLRSPLWASIRIRVLERCGTRCEVCSKKMAAQVHHRAYDPATLRGDSIDALTATCFGCHIKAERRYKRGAGDTGQVGYQRHLTANTAILKGVRKAAKRARKAIARAAGPRLVKHGDC
jgi:hypothetical protein